MLSQFSSSYNLGRKTSYNPPPPPADPYTRFQFSISGSNYTGTPSQYPITFNPSNQNDTYGNITNIDLNLWRNQAFTIYVKGKFNNSASLQNLIYLGNSSFTNSTNFISITHRGSASALHIAFGYRDPGTTSITGNSISMLASSSHFIHTFVCFDGTQIQYYFYSSITGNLIYSSVASNYPSSTMMNAFTTFTMGHNINNISNCGNITIDEAGWYNTRKTTTEMSAIVASNLN